MPPLTLSPPTKLDPTVLISTAILGLFGIAVIGLHTSGLQLSALNLNALSDRIISLGPWGPIAYIAILILSIVISQIPGAPLVILAGTIWTPFWATIFTIIGGFAGAILAYGLGRQLGAPFIQKMTGQTFQIESAQPHRLGIMIFLARLFPVIPFDLLSYGAGVSQLSLPLYATATLFGMIPSTLLLAYGTTIDLSTLFAVLQP